MRWVVLVLLVACVDTGPGPAPRVDQKYAREHLLQNEPKEIDRFDVAFGDKAIYLGNKVERARLVPGQTMTVTHYWKVVKPLGKTWRLFALVRGPAGSADFMNLEPSDMQVAHPVATWKPGEIIEDVQTITMRPDWQSPSAVLYVGLIEVGKHGTLDRMAVNGPRTQDRAVVAATLDIDLSRAPPPPGTVHVPKANGAMTIDGMQIDPGWQTSVTSPEFVTAENAPCVDANGKATARLTWDDQYLYVFVSIVDTDIVSPYKNHDDTLWKADAVEIFIDADGNRRGYIEVQVNPRNAVFDAWFAGPRGPAGDFSWSSNMVTEVKVRGTADPGDSDQAWEAEIGIPWAAVKGKADQMPVTIPPRVGDRWKLNVVRVDAKSGSDKTTASSWNRITCGDWHALDRMLTVVFADTTGSIVPADPRGAGSGAGGASIAPPMQGSAAGSGVGSGVQVEAQGSNAGSAAPKNSGSGSSAPASGSGSSAPASGSGSSAPAKNAGSGSSAPARNSGSGSAAAGSAGSGSAAGSAQVAPIPPTPVEPKFHVGSGRAVTGSGSPPK